MTAEQLVSEANRYFDLAAVAFVNHEQGMHTVNSLAHSACAAAWAYEVGMPLPDEMVA